VKRDESFRHERYQGAAWRPVDRLQADPDAVLPFEPATAPIQAAKVVLQAVEARSGGS
jgi:hypothetical protein